MLIPPSSDAGPPPVRASHHSPAVAPASSPAPAQVPAPAQKSVQAPAQPSDQLSLSQPSGVEFDVLSLNTFGLPKPLGQAIAARHSRIGQAIGNYEVVGFQETFSADSKHLAKGAALAGLSFHVHAPAERRLLNSGLSTFSQYEIVETGFRPFSYGSHADALAAKGVSFSRIRVPGGGLIDVYNTHFQAARDKADGALDKLWLKAMAQIFPGYDMPRDQIRVHDAEVLIQYVKDNDAGHPLIVLGDFNTQENQPVYQQLRTALGLQDAFREANPSEPGYTSDGLSNPYKHDPDKRKRVDYIFYRPGETQTLKVLSSELAFDQAVDGLFVSDHYGVHTRFRLEPKPLSKP